VIFGLHVEVFLALAYALFLTGVAFFLELLARRSHARAEDYRNAGFIYFRELDYFECPAGHRLVQLETDRQRRVTSYRAPAAACNSCPLKLNCTDSDGGRVVERPLHARLESELGRFHRGISLMLLLLATVLLLAEAFRYPQRRDCGALAVLLLPLGLAQFKLAPSFWIRRASLRNADQDLLG
jgi:hypothetical protein